MAPVLPGLVNTGCFVCGTDLTSQELKISALLFHMNRTERDALNTKDGGMGVIPHQVPSLRTPHSVCPQQEAGFRFFDAAPDVRGHRWS